MTTLLQFHWRASWYCCGRCADAGHLSGNYLRRRGHPLLDVWRRMSGLLLRHLADTDDNDMGQGRNINRRAMQRKWQRIVCFFFNIVEGVGGGGWVLIMSETEMALDTCSHYSIIIILRSLLDDCPSVLEVISSTPSQLDCAASLLLMTRKNEEVLMCSRLEKEILGNCSFQTRISLRRIFMDLG